MPTKTRTRLSDRSPTHRFAAVLVGTALGAHTLLSSPMAHAEQVSGSGKGIAGGALLGGEVVVMAESLVGIHSGWAHIVGALVGAGGGGYAGYLAENESTDGRLPILMLGAGISLFIPAVVISLNATSYQPSANASEDRAPTNEQESSPSTAKPPSASTENPAAPGKVASERFRQPSEGRPKAIFSMAPGNLRLSVPVPEVGGVFTPQQLKESGATQRTEYRLPLVHVAF